jgi:hypothetical protein
MIIQMAPTGNKVKVTHRITNTRAWEVEFALWGLTMMAPGGQAFTGFPPRGPHPDNLPPTHPLVMWAYSNISDPRWTFTLKYMALKQDPNNAEPQKLGLFNEHTWGAYLLGTDMFLKQTRADRDEIYPDYGCSYETFTNADMLELETLGPLIVLGQGDTGEHVEYWSLHKDVSIPNMTDEELDKVFEPLLRFPD